MSTRLSYYTKLPFRLGGALSIVSRSANESSRVLKLPQADLHREQVVLIRPFPYRPISSRIADRDESQYRLPGNITNATRRTMAPLGVNFINGYGS